MPGDRAGAAARPLIAHVVHRFDVGGMENGLVNLINRLPAEFADHCVIALTEANPGFAARIRRPGVRIHELHRPAGQTARIFPRLYRLLRSLRPAVFHTRNAGTLETQLVAWAARVPVRIHGEHGWDMADLAGANRKLLTMRRVMRHFVHHQIALSSPTASYLTERVGVPAVRVTNICNGVDTARFTPPQDRTAVRARLAPQALPAEAFVVGAVGRLSGVKNLPMLVEAFAKVAGRNEDFARQARLVLVGDGPERQALAGRIAGLQLAQHTLLAGAQDNVPEWLQALDLLCLPSLAEGISNAILEAMASGLPVLATAVGGNPELVEDGRTGRLVPSQDTAALADRIEAYFTDRATLAAHGAAARRLAVTKFSLDTMVNAYHRVYVEQLIRAGVLPARAAQRADPGLHT
ncbi:TIGR03088 family PEP-CTERM/XrtA system glycosyltransferase [Quisquiliibacterium transsilvanicum]|uniref:Sugar transferase (PEP-CTERM/EpsH1 system associated) n=1 Tax=Quisquiliibacterium transsilvanicum TaxID=1549638 RepID=A0A7W8M6M0_9BURK|nr:TIGR03088 family PEP-CTERM/XrtA system glycosyltransferase [Quisquiliibacterium transsilvanicum]MBB5270041.1 sugar transferase (PEP-CTERM/EpsH1 system associated) [Quisquiliibacterium transsilvanicum]